MTQPVKRFLYLVHGAPSYHQEAAYSMLSLWRQPGGSEFEIVVVTDDPAPLRALIADPPQLRYPVWVFIDSDTAFTRPPNPWFDAVARGGVVLSETVALIDTLYPVVPIHTIEQVALSIILQDRQQAVQTCEEGVLSYHTFKEFRGDLARFFAHYPGASVSQLLVAWPEVDPVQRIVPKQEFNALPKWRRKLKRYLGSGWKPLPLPW